MPALKVKAAGVWQTIMGPQGAQGPTGPTGPAGPSGVPVGTPMPWLLPSAPSGFLVADGSQFDGTVYPALAALYGSTFGAVSGNLYRLPNLKGKFLVGQDTADTGTVNVDRISALGDTGGVKRVTLSSAESGSPAHQHNYSGTTAAETQDHSHSGSTGGQSADHTHAVTVRQSNRVVTGGGAATVTDSAASVTGTAGASNDHSHAFTTGGRSAQHNHTFSGTTDSGNSGVPALSSHQNMPPYYTCQWIIRATP
jgi:microcystin-dependent protein